MAGSFGPSEIGLVRVLGIGDATVRTPAAGNTVTVATVTAATIGGQPVVATDRGLLLLQAHAGLPPGTRLTLEIIPPPTPSPLPPLVPLDTVTGRGWPALQHALDALDTADPQAARALAQAVLPQMNGRLATNMALFMGIMRSGMDPRGWLGDRGTRAIEATGRGDVLDRLADDVRSLQRQAEGAGSEWRTYPLPLMVDGAMDRVVVRVRRRDDDEEDGDRAADRSAGGTRFLVDVNLSRLGPLQLDGLARPKRLDLIIRSRDALATPLQGELKQIFAGTVAELRLAGDLVFQSGRGATWVPLAVAPASARGIVA
jgi:hypothetical protein